MKIAKIPKYCLHKATGQAVVWLGKRCVYLGKYGSVASKEEYERQIRDWLARGKEVGPPSEMPLLNLAALYWDDQKKLRGYQDGGRRVGPIDGIHQMLHRITRAYGEMPAVEFGPQRLHEFRMQMIEEGLSRRYVNGLVNWCRHMFKWAVAREYLPVSVHQSLALLPGLRQDEYGVRETPPVTAVPDEVVDATLPHRKSLGSELD